MIEANYFLNDLNHFSGIEMIMFNFQIFHLDNIGLIRNWPPFIYHNQNHILYLSKNDRQNKEKQIFHMIF